jgi:hypothetical protein
MFSWRHSRLVRVVAVFLLLWAAADMSNASLCAQENEDGGFSVSASAPAVRDDAASTPAHAPVQHVDDCFCCSHCVEVIDIAPALLSSPVASEFQMAGSGAPRSFGSRLYHPPLV